MSRIVSLILFLLSVVVVGWVIGLTNLPGEWYSGLNKPSFNPPNWLFAPVWTLIYVLIAVAGWRTFNNRDAKTGKVLWGLQMVLNYAWSPVFFGAHLILGGLFIILTLFATIVCFIVIQWWTDRLSAQLFVPYAVWVGFASLLNFEIFRLN